jgi:ABC-type microcin C transport system permease subunit YejB
MMALLGLVSKILADVTLVFVDPRISFDKAPGYSHDI